MADLGYVRTLLRRITDANTRIPLEQSFTHTLENLRFGVPDHQTRAGNFQCYWLQSTTAASTGEFSIQHGLGDTPRYAIPVLRLSQVGARAGGLVVSRAADNSRIYLKADAGSTSAPIALLIE